MENCALLRVALLEPLRSAPALPVPVRFPSFVDDLLRFWDKFEEFLFMDALELVRTTFTLEDECGSSAVEGLVEGVWTLALV